jgi:hypothetical protein
LILSPILTVLGIVPGIIHACACVSASNRKHDLRKLAGIVGKN